jgi:hypothetical protein
MTLHIKGPFIRYLKRLPVLIAIVVATVALAVALTWPALADDDPAKPNETQDGNGDDDKNGNDDKDGDDDKDRDDDKNGDDDKDGDHNDKPQRNRATELDEELDRIIEEQERRDIDA